MGNRIQTLLICATSAALLTCTEAEKTKDGPTSPVVHYTETRQPCTDRNEDRNLYFGDLHVHTRLSFDAYGYEVRTTPAQAYGFAKGEELYLPPLDTEGRGTRPVRLARPLDFVALTDHQEYLAETHLCATPGTEAYDSFLCQNFREGNDLIIALFGIQFTDPSPVRFRDICQAPGVDCRETARQI